ncbi:DUF1254 domain-containing protein [Halosquirtibacter xylanolyticus]|uniref:DUF1254 domain-containing protein n=1 Tax=Halosquirtibacter xylanolyticus TaxID=3374599 RepID=UPI00374A4C68|nr:DUF1254 domain-containing protein [Prolixibacteraceae bacterium]
MKKRLNIALLISICIVFLSSCGGKMKKNSDKTVDVDDAIEVYDYTYPLVIMGLSQDLMLDNPLRPKQKPNCLIKFKQLAQPKNKAVVLGNRNTLYTVGWIDLSKGPVIFTFPDMGERYFVMPLIDAWTNTFKSIGSRTTGQGPKKYFLVNDSFKGDTPSGFEKIVCPTNMVWITGRIQADNDDDAKKAAMLQDKYVVMTYQEYNGGENPFKTWKAQYSALKVRKPVPYTLKMSAKEYYDLFLKMFANNQTFSFDTEMVKLLGKFGVERGKTLSFDQLSSTSKKVLTDGLVAQQKIYLEAFYKGSSQKKPWIFDTTEMGVWGDNYKKRAYWAMWGLGANLVEDAVYGVTQLDSDMKSLDGGKVYVIHFDKGGEPDVGAFWSITTYNIEGYLEKNSENRYASGSNMPLKYNKDGSLDLYMSFKKPKGVAEYNWIPAPQKEFKILFRMYWPKESVLDGTWKLPSVVQK